MSANSKNVCVVVLGDIGRSPRMQYHSLSLAECGHKVDIVGYGETRPLDSLIAQPLVSIHYLNPYPNVPLPKLFNYAFKTLWQCITLIFVFLLVRRPDVVLVQNPPAIPGLLICWLYKALVGAKLIVDWHNYAHSIMSMSLNSHHVLVKITKFLEFKIGALAENNFCVTDAMKEDLLNKWGISSVTLYDKPQESFREITLEEKHEILNCLALKYKELAGEDGNVFTKIENDSVEMRKDRPGILISSTSWTEDEDFSILLSALQDYEDSIKNGNFKKLPELFCIITGKGPLKSYYLSKLAQLNWKHVCVVTPWLESNEYPLLLASADLGVCLHTSSSGLDLPMKVVDMFGCCLPVCAYKFKCIDELVKHEENSYTFHSSSELSEEIQQWFANFPNNRQQRDIENRFKTALREYQKIRWKNNWLNIVATKF